ncbi:MAG: hypothetical protein QOI11_369, partial [Candidatus Eremiobacteraeota bacterium]|nr:hypothetical protein [Candidatus Eremiobacteraeota bacterium]
VDTAEMYGDAELVVAEAFEGRRDEVFLVSKVLPSNATYAGTIAACERSLHRMGTDYLDCYLLHWRGSVPLRETMRALEKLLDDGKIRALGVSNFAVSDLEEAQAALAHTKLACNQVLYNLAERTVEDHELPWCRAHEVALVGYTPLGRGDWTDRPGARVLEEIGRAHGITARAVILAFLTRDPSAFTIPKASTVAHVEENAAAGELRLSEDEIARIDAAFPKRKRRGGLPTL